MSGTTDFTTGKIGKDIVMFTMPIFLGSMIQQGYQIVDSAIVGRMIGTDALAAVGVSTPFVMAVVILMNGFGIGVSILMSQLFGAKNEDEIRNLAFSTVTVFAVVCVALTIVLVSSSEFILRHLLNTPEAIFRDANDYMRIYMASLTFVFLYNVYAYMLRSMGNAKAAMVYLTVFSVVNVVLDIIFVGPLKMGVFGAGLATLISQALSAALIIIYAGRRVPVLNIFAKDARFDKRLFKRCMTFALPNVFQQLLLGSSNVFLQRFVNSFDTAVIAAQSAAVRLDAIPTQGALSLSRALSSFAGQNFGAGRFDRISKGLRFCLILGCALGLLITAVYCVVPEQLIMLFLSGDEALAANASEVAAKGAALLSVTAFSYVFMFAAYAVIGLLRGTGDVMFTSIGTFVIVAVRVAVAYGLDRFTDIGYLSIALSMLFMWMLGAVGMIMRYRSGGWRHSGAQTHVKFEKDETYV